MKLPQSLNRGRVGGGSAFFVHVTCDNCHGAQVYLPF
jgi:hypothetical protein